MTVKSFVQFAGGIDWYCEIRGTGPVLVLIPSGEGDCANFETTAALLADRFSVLTFDTPGYSRSGAPTDPAQISVPNLAGQIATLVRALGVDKATFYGCSSGGRAVLDLVCTEHELVRNGIVHEAALASPHMDAQLGKLAALDDATAVQVCKHMFAKVMNEDEGAWMALGSDYHARLERNYLTWVRRYIGQGLGAPIDPQALQRRPVAWTVGSLSDQAAFAGNYALADAAGIEVTALPSRHFPQVSIPGKLAEHISAATAPYLT